MRLDPRAAARRAYERHRLTTALPWLLVGLLGAVASFWNGIAAWPLALAVGVGAAFGRYHGRDVGSGLVAGAAFGSVAAIGMVAYSYVGCCGSACGSCSDVCMAICTATGALAGITLRRSPTSLLGAIPLLLVAMCVGLSATGTSMACAAMAATAVAGTWLVKSPFSR